ncbi:ribonucleotide reductase, alpha subunit, partial [mine drainage metagenome]
MTIKITHKIKSYSVARADATGSNAAPAVPEAEVIQMHERLQRPEVLVGSTYKIKSPLFEHALYVTINDIVLNAGTPHESRRP